MFAFLNSRIFVTNMYEYVCSNRNIKHHIELYDRSRFIESKDSIIAFDPKIIFQYRHGRYSIPPPVTFAVVERVLFVFFLTSFLSFAARASVTGTRGACMHARCRIVKNEVERGGGFRGGLGDSDRLRRTSVSVYYGRRT